MNAKDVILRASDMAEHVFKSYLKDLSDADLLVRPVEGQNHIAWQLGHLIASERQMVEMVSPGASPPLPEGFAEAHANNEESNRSDDPARFCSKATYLELFDKQRAATKAALAATPDADLDNAPPNTFGGFLPNVGAVYLLAAGTHHLMHAGQFVSVRRKLGKPVAI